MAAYLDWTRLRHAPPESERISRQGFVLPGFDAPSRPVPGVVRQKEGKATANPATTQL